MVMVVVTAPSGPFKAVPCNAFAFCPDEVCFEPDAHHHTKGDCWLKFTEGPAWPEVGHVLTPLNTDYCNSGMDGGYRLTYIRRRRQHRPEIVHCCSGAPPAFAGAYPWHAVSRPPSASSLHSYRRFIGLNPPLPCAHVPPVAAHLLLSCTMKCL